MDEPLGDSSLLLHRHCSGDPAALEALVKMRLPWLRLFVHRQLGARLHRLGETSDFVQVALLRLLRWSPSPRGNDAKRFRPIMAAIVANTVRNGSAFISAQKRGVDRTVRLPDDADAGVALADWIPNPAECAGKRELLSMVEQGLKLLPPLDRKVVLARKVQGLSFEAIGKDLSISASGASKRFNRAFDRLARIVRAMCRGECELSEG